MPEDHNARGNEHYSAGDYLAALSEYTAAAELVPTSAVFASKMAAACLMLKRYRDAADAALRATALDPTFTMAATLAAKALLFLGRFDEARGQYAAALGREPGNAALRSELVDLYRAKAMSAASTTAVAHSQWQVALEAADVGLGLSPASQKLYLLRAQALMGLRRWSDAVDQCLKLEWNLLEPGGPDPSQIYLLLADALYQTGGMEVRLLQRTEGGRGGWGGRRGGAPFSSVPTFSFGGTEVDIF